MPVIVELRVAVLDAGCEVVGERIFYAGAKGPAPVRIIEAGSGRCFRYGIDEDIISIEAGERDTACCINQDAIKCDAEACAERALHGEIARSGQGGSILERIGSCAVDAGAFDVSLKTGN